jgi:flagellar motor switch protein FliM
MSQPSAGAARAVGRSPRRSKSAGPQAYDFRRPTKLAREHVRTLQLCYETFARRYGQLVTSTLRVVGTVSLISIEQLTYEEYIASLNSPTILALVTLEPLPGTAILELSLATAMTSIDHLLGGPGGPQPERQLSEIETPLLRGLLDRVLEELAIALEPVSAVRPQLGAIEYNPQFLNACNLSDAVVVASFELRIGAEECVATLCLPLATIFPKLNEDHAVVLTDSQRAVRDRAHHNLVAGLETAPIDVAVRFNPLTLRPEEILALRPGDVVRLDHPVAEPLAVIAGETTFGYAVPGNQGSRLACLVVPAPKEDTRR